MGFPQMNLPMKWRQVLIIIVVTIMLIRIMLSYGISNLLFLYDREQTSGLEIATDIYIGNRAAWRAIALNSNAHSDINAFHNASPMLPEIVQRGEIALQDNQISEAIDWLRLATKLAPNEPYPLYRLGEALHRQGNLPASISLLESAIAKLPEDPDYEGQLYLLLGKSLAQSNPPAWTEAEKAFRQAIQANTISDPWQKWDPYFELGLALRQQAKNEEAISQFEAVAAARPTDYWVHIQLGLTSWELGSLQDAERYFLQAIDINGKEKWAYLWLAVIYRESEKTVASLQMFDRVLERDPQDQFAIEQRELLLLQMPS
ncbi:MAG: tetratricopeptide repeat protein [Anaerolineales bacterium]|nr:tetratricopeptide repeat protein [Anaerolineales bacterium]